MKRTIAFLLALVMLLSLMACGKKSEEAKTAEEPTEAAEASETAEAPETSGMTAGEEAAANESAAAGEDTDDGTIVENGIARTPCSSLDEINNALGGKLCKPVTVDSVDVSMELDKDENGVEFGTYIFSISDIYCGVRFSPDFNADLSGVVKEDGTSLFEGMEGDFTMEYEGTELAHWVTVDGQYVLLVNSNEKQLFEPLLEELKVLSSGAEITQDPETGEYTVVEHE